MTREETVAAIAEVEREVNQGMLSQDTLVVLHRKLQGLETYVSRYNLPSTKVNVLIESIEAAMTVESAERALHDAPITPSAPKVGLADALDGFQIGGGTVHIDEDDEATYEPPCDHAHPKTFNDEGLPECTNCGYVFHPPPTQATPDRKQAIGDLFGKDGL